MKDACLSVTLRAQGRGMTMILDKDYLNWDKTFSAAQSNVGNNALGVDTGL